ncbi:1135_t:CDS:10 [Acaulospora colombiana]|uniref:1135_t:CDS:1 n=1 Tax=Acaulospora colombiana TaxID=27376 RepID=A0ACA9LU01_9GLOM|nr:1135_t:CDS:10 [Acaulospora colombiana]
MGIQSFAHPFQNTWEVESPFKKELTNRSRSRSATPASNPSGKTSQNGFVAEGSAKGASKSAVDAMDIDPLSSHHSPAPQSGNLPPESLDMDDTEDNYSSNETFVDLDPIEIEAVVDFLCDIIESLRANSRLAHAQTDLDRYKKNYSAYSDLEKNNLTNIVGKSSIDSWVNDRRAKMKVIEENDRSLQKWINKLRALEEPSKSNDRLDGHMERRMEISGEQAGPVAISDGPGPLSLQPKKQMELGEAFHQRRRRFRRGWLSERLDDARATIEDIRHRFEERKALEAAEKESSRHRLLITAGEDVDMQESSLSEVVEQTPEQRFLVLRNRLQFIIEQIDQADIWGTNLEGELEVKFEETVDNILESFLQEEMAANPALPSGEEQSTEIVDNNLSLIPVSDLYNSIVEIKQVSDAFLKIGNKAPIFDPQIQVQIDQVNRGIASLETSINQLSQGITQFARHQAERPTSMPEPELETLGRSVFSTQQNVLGRFPEIQSVLSMYCVDPNQWPNSRPQIHPVPAQEILNQEVNAWNAEYEELQRQCLAMVQPLIDRSDVQKRELEEAARRRREQTTLGPQNATISAIIYKTPLIAHQPSDTPVQVEEAGGRRDADALSKEIRLQAADSNMDGGVTGEHINTPPPTRRRQLIGHDEDELMANRASLDSTASTVFGEEEDDDNDREHDWTEDQVAILVRTLEEGCPPNAARWSAPKTPYVLPFVPDNLLDVWARQLKRYNWPHNVRHIRKKLRQVAKNVAEDDRQQAAKSSSGSEDEEGQALMEFEEARGQNNDLIISPTMDYPLHSGPRNDLKVYKSSMKFQRNERVLNLPSASYHPYSHHARPRSPMKTPRSPSVEPVSPIDSYFPNSPTHNQFSPRSASRGSDRPRSRSISPLPTRRLNGHDGSPSPSKSNLQMPSLSPMKLSPRKPFDDSLRSRRGEGSPDPTDLLTALAGDQSIGRGIRPPRAPLPKSFFTRDMMRPQGQRQGQVPELQSDPFFSGGNGSSSDIDQSVGLTTPSTTLSSTGRTPFSSISSASSLFSTQSRSTQPPNSALASQPSLPSLTISHPHLTEGMLGRNGMKRSASFSKPHDGIKRAPSYGAMENPNPRLAKGSSVHSNANNTNTNGVLREEPQIPPVLSGHKRERSDTSYTQVKGSEASGYDTEDADMHPPSSAPSSDPISQYSPLKPAFEPSPVKSKKSSPTKPQGAGARFSISSPGALLASPTLLPAKLFGRKKSVRPKQDRPNSRIGETGSADDRERTMSLSPSPLPSPSLYGAFPGSSAVPATPGSQMDIDTEMGFLSTRSPTIAMQSMALSPSPGYSNDPDETITPRRDGEPRRKRVKTDELTTPPKELRSLNGGLTSPQMYNHRALSTPRATSPRDLLDATPRTTMKTPPRRSRHMSSKTPPRRGSSATKSPRLLPGAARRRSTSRPISPVPSVVESIDIGETRRGVSSSSVTGSQSPRSSLRLRARSGISPLLNGSVSRASGLATIPGGDSDREQARIRATSLISSRPLPTVSPVTTSRTLAVREKSQRPGLQTIISSEENVPTVRRTSKRTTPKREPSFFGAELVLKPNPARTSPMGLAPSGSRPTGGTEEKKSLRRVGTTKFPATSTTSISSVLFPGGPSDLAALQSNSDDSNQQTDPSDPAQFEGVGNGEEGVIRAGESAALARRGTNQIGRARENCLSVGLRSSTDLPTSSPLNLRISWIPFFATTSFVLLSALYHFRAHLRPLTIVPPTLLTSWLHLVLL